jgi:glycosyltransferase involved in cell wall biosynthesis
MSNAYKIYAQKQQLGFGIINILQVHQVFNPNVASGAAKVAYDVSRFLIKRGHKIVFYASDMEDWLSRGTSGDSIVDGIKVRRFRTLWQILARELRIYVTPQLATISGDEIQKFDIIHLHGYTSFQSVVMHHYAKKYGVPYVLQAHGAIPRTGAWRRLKWLFDVFFGYRLLRDASKVIALSEIEAKEYAQAGVSRAKIAIIPNGIDLEEYRNLPPKGIFKKRFNIGKDKKIILFLGRINRFKGIDCLIDAFAYMTKSAKNDNVVLVIAGPDDGYLNETKVLVDRHEIGWRVFFSGPLFGMRKIEAYVDASIVASLDSLKEVVFLLVPLEAAASGTPVIVATSNYIATLIKEGNFGLAVECGNVPGLVTALEEILNDENLQKQMGLNGRKFVYEHFGWSNSVDKIVRVYEDAVKRSQEISTSAKNEKHKKNSDKRTSSVIRNSGSAHEFEKIRFQNPARARDRSN